MSDDDYGSSYDDEDISEKEFTDKLDHPAPDEKDPDLN